MNGWIKTHRKIIEWEWFTVPNMFHVFSYLLLSANTKDTKFQGLDLKKGQLVTGLFSLKEATGVSIQSLRTCLKRLKSSGEITVKSTNKYSVITICNYSMYQFENKTANKQSTSNQQATNNRQEVKKLRSKKNGANGVQFEAFWNVFSDKRGKKGAEKAFKKALKRATFEEIEKGAKQYAVERERILKNGGTPKMAQGWLSDDRWTDEFNITKQSKWD